MPGAGTGGKTCRLHRQGDGLGPLTSQRLAVPTTTGTAEVERPSVSGQDRAKFVLGAVENRQRLALGPAAVGQGAAAEEVELTVVVGGVGKFLGVGVEGEVVAGVGVFGDGPGGGDAPAAARRFQQFHETDRSASQDR